MTNQETGQSRLGKILNNPDLWGILALALLCLAFFWRMVFTDQILPRGDTFAYFYPYWAYRNSALAAGQIPLWNPYLFMGVPFLANSQAGVLYPLNWPLAWLDAPTAVKVAIVTHVVLAAWGTYFLARRAFKLTVLGAVLAGGVFALGGYLTSQVEHVNQLQGLAWLPWELWLWDEAIRRASRRASWLFTVVLAMQLLAGHSQTAFISLVGVDLWTLWHIAGELRALRAQGKSIRELVRMPESLLQEARPLLMLAVSGIGAAGLAAAQLLPTLELTRLSNRSGGLPFIEAISFSLRPYLIGRSMLPGFTHPALFSEYVAYIGIAALVLALIGGWSSRKDWRTLGVTLLAASALFLALGAYNPVYWGLVRVVPGFGLFRAPARWLALWALASALMAGVGLDWLAGVSRTIKLQIRVIALPCAIVIILAAATFLATISGTEVPGASQPKTSELAIWLGTLAATAGLLLLHPVLAPARAKYATTALAVLAVVELFGASLIEPFNQLTVPQAWSGQRPAITTILAADHGITPPPRFLSLSDIEWDPGDLHEIEASYAPYLTDAQIYDYVIATKQKEILAPNLPLYWQIPAMDGFDGGILPTRDYTRFTSLFVDPDRQAPDGRLRENLKAVPDLEWLRIANVRWIITDKVFDAWLDGIYFDLQFPEQRSNSSASPAGPIEAFPAEAFEATSLGLVGHIETDAALAAGTRIGVAKLISEDGSSQEISLDVDPTQPAGIGAAGSPSPELVGTFTPNRPDIIEYRTLAAWADARRVSQVNIRLEANFTGTLVVKGMTLIDTRTGAFSSLTLSQGHCLSVANSGDVKVYRYDCAQPRAYLVCNPRTAQSEDEVWSSLQALPSSGETVIEDTASSSASCDASHLEDVTINQYEPERIVMSAHAETDGTYLILADTWYPGWEASVDGQPEPILRANGIFRAVRLSKGDHEITFAYRSKPFEIGIVISLVSLLVAVVGLAWPILRKDRTRTG